MGNISSNPIKTKQLDPFNTALNALPIIKKDFFEWAISMGLIKMKLKTAIAKSYNSTSKGRNGNIEVKAFTLEEQHQIKNALTGYAALIKFDIENFKLLN
jgi:hypothetical protein